jgi:hypothetical protein
MRSSADAAPRFGLLGAAAVPAGYLCGLASVLILPTLSTRAADQAEAISAHRDLVLAGGAVDALGAVLVVAGVVWWATRLPVTATVHVGAVLGAGGMAAVLFDAAAQVSSALLLAGQDPSSAAEMLHRLGAATSVTGPISVLNDIGVIVLALVTRRVLGSGGAGGTTSVWAWLFVAGAVVEAVGFATGSRPAAAIGLLGALVALVVLVPRLARPGIRQAPAR